jgi:hypothetical protein
LKRQCGAAITVLPLFLALIQGINLNHLSFSILKRLNENREKGEKIMAEELENKETEKTGSEPDDKTKGAASSTVGSEKGGDSQTHDEDKDKPWNKDPRFQKDNAEYKERVKAYETVKKIMTDNDLDSLEDLVDHVESGKKVIGKITDLENIDELIAKAQKLDQWTEYYARQAEIEKEQAETSEETIARLKKERAQMEQRLTQDTAAREGEALIKDFSKTVESTVNEVFEDLPETQKQFITEFFGVNNPFAVIDIGDKRAIKKMVSEGKKKFETLKMAIEDKAIKDYVDGKRKIPVVSKTGESTSPQTIRKTMKTARAAMHERLDHLFG